MIVLTVKAMDVFPTESQLYSDVETDEWVDMSPIDIINEIYDPNNLVEAVDLPNFTIGAILGVLIGASIILGIFTHVGPIVPSIILIGIAIWPLIITSRGFFNQILNNWNIMSMTYIGLTFGVGIIIIVVITLIEQPAHGRSG